MVMMVMGTPFLLRTQLLEPYQSIELRTTQLRRIHDASDLLKKVSSARDLHTAKVPMDGMNRNPLVPFPPGLSFLVHHGKASPICPFLLLYRGSERAGQGSRQSSGP